MTPESTHASTHAPAHERTARSAPRPRQPRYRRDVDGALLLSVSDAALHFGVSRRTIYNWMAAGRLVCRRQPGGQRRVVIEQMAVETSKTPGTPAREAS